MKLNMEDRMLQVVVYTALALLSFVTFYPVWNTLVISLNEGSDTALGGLTFWPRAFTMENYQVVFKNDQFFQSLWISVARAVSGTFISILFTALLAYSLSKSELMGRKFYMMLAVITMFFSGGLIPTYLWLRELHMFDNFWVLIIPGMVNVWNMIVFRTFFRGLPDGIEESAKVDGCGNYGIFFRIVMPLSGPILATLSLFTAVTLWNEWFNASIYINNQQLIPIQTYLINVINSSSFQEQMAQITGASGAMNAFRSTVTSKSLQMTTIMVATLPIVIVYPFVQRFFVQGVMVGSLKE
ncbi:carbohydrate ABC transporter permease [Paenibacillus sp. GCM10023252]|uniref:carbohydrate ABC transporter permease n=1 Tax=Paenibacillus sp. GCM10023252 TaxID=3252649 RepID=UPI0036211D71